MSVSSPMLRLVRNGIVGRIRFGSRSTSKFPSHEESPGIASTRPYFNDYAAPDRAGRPPTEGTKIVSQCKEANLAGQAFLRVVFPSGGASARHIIRCNNDGHESSVPAPV